MASIEQIVLPRGATVDQLWSAVAHGAQRWLAQQGLPVRDAVMLVPFAALLAPARAAFAAGGGWQPKIETALTLAAALGPPPARDPDGCSGDLALDRLTAGRLLRRQAWGASWDERQPQRLMQAAARLVDATDALRHAALQRPPAARQAFWNQARALTSPLDGPAQAEGRLQRLALEWAAAGGPAPTDRLFAARPSAWIVLRFGGADELAEALLDHAGTPSLQLCADPPLEDPYALAACAAGLEQVICDDFEAEAQATTAQVIAALNEGRTPVALVALDRKGLRRVRALLERAQVPVLDETGWRLATTPAAARVTALVRAALPDAGPDARLEWLKSRATGNSVALDSLEALWRGRRQAPEPAAAERLWQQARQQLLRLRGTGTRTLLAWRDTLLECLAEDDALEPLRMDAAGATLLAALGWPEPAPWQQAGDLQLGLEAFAEWLEAMLEHTAFLPPAQDGAEVVITPLARAFGRPFAHVVVPAADRLRLGDGDAAVSLWPGAAALALGIDDALRRRERQRLALAQLLRAERVTLLRRLRDDDEPMAESPEVEWLRLSRRRAGVADWPQTRWQAPTLLRHRDPVPRPLPRAAQALASRLSASELEALRGCPYRFYSRAVLGLQDPEELEAGIAKRDYGTWLHEVLHRFHSHPGAASGGLPLLHQVADEVTRALDLDASDLLPFRASFETLAPRYLEWLARRQSQGWRWLEGEVAHEREVPGLAGLRLRGRLDRLDEGPGERRQLFDYKTSSVTALKRRVAQPLEDTQLSFYAALLGADESLSAAYLALDEADAPVEVVHASVHLSAAAMLQGLGSEWQRLRAGAALPALGEGAICETCEARGLCRRDHWHDR